MSKYLISQKAARKFLLSYHHLLPPKRLKGKQGILEYFSKVGCIQYDPLNIVGRNVELTLQSRISGFRQELLDQLLYTDRLLLDGWDKMMSIVTTADWPFLARVRAIRSGLQSVDSSLCNQVLERIKVDGPLSAKDFTGKSSGTNSWGPRKQTSAALDYLYLKGDLCVIKRINTQRVYDLTSRYLPDDIIEKSDPFASDDEFWQWYVERRIGSVGLAWSKGNEAWLGYILENKTLRLKALKQLEKSGTIKTIEIEGLPGVFYIREQDFTTLQNFNSVAVSRQSALLAPLDNLLWDRKMLSTLFGFTYTWEVYLPEKKRKYGYYVLPVLYGDRFVARFEPKLDKQTNTLIIKNWWWEKHLKPSITMKKSITASLRQFMRFANAKNLEIKRKKELGWLMKY